MARNGTLRARIAADILGRSTPFTAEDIMKAVGVKQGTASSAIALLKAAGVIKYDPTTTTGRAHAYTVARHTTPERAVRSMRRNRKAYRADRRAARRSPPITGLSALREAVDKAQRYDKLLAYLGLTDDEVVATLA